MADEVWRRFGAVQNYVEPFCGSCAVLLGAPVPARYETVNDIDGYVTNVWRALAWAPDEVLKYIDWPVNELDLHARNFYMIKRREEFTERMREDPGHFDAKLAGWWLYGKANSIGNQWGKRNRSIPNIARINGTSAMSADELRELFGALTTRIREARFVCGHWRRVLTPTVTWKLGFTGVLLDPPYGKKYKRDKVYVHDDFDLCDQVREWALYNGTHPKMRIALCGYREHDELGRAGWTCYRWKAAGGYSKNKQSAENNRFHETIWFSPGCVAE